MKSLPSIDTMGSRPDIIRNKRIFGMIYGIMASTVFFFIALMGLTIWAMHDFPTNTQLR